MADNDYPLKAFDGTVVSQTELPAELPAGTTRDEVELARFGKLQQLKVSPELSPSTSSNKHLTVLAEKLWFDLDSRPDMYAHDNVGGHALVSNFRAANRVWSDVGRTVSLPAD